MSQNKISRVGTGMALELDRAKSLMEGLAPAVSIYGSARILESDPYYQATVCLARGLSEHGINTISGGGPGIMEAANRGAKEGGRGLSVGLNIELDFEPVPNAFQDVSINFQHFSSRKTAFCKYASAFVVMPGGFGTLDELFEVLTLIQTRKTARIPVILFGSEFWGGLIQWVNGTLLARGLISDQDMSLFVVVDSVDEALATCLEAAYPAAAKVA